MNTILDTLQKYGIPIHSYILAVQSLTDIELTPDQYRDRIKELSGHDSKAEDKHIRIHYHYLIQETVRRYMDTGIVDMGSVFISSDRKASEYCGKNPWIFVDKANNEVTASINSDAPKKQKKGAKKIHAKEVWEKNKDVERTRKEWIALLVGEVGLTPAGASTYYSNLKNNKF